MNQSISEEFREKFPCKQSGCDGNGTIAEHGCNGSSEDCDATCPVAVQCQYCFEVRFPMEAFIQSKISQALAARNKELIEEIEDIDVVGKPECEDMLNDVIWIILKEK